MQVGMKKKNHKMDTDTVPWTCKERRNTEINKLANKRHKFKPK